MSSVPRRAVRYYNDAAADGVAIAAIDAPARGTYRYPKSPCQNR